MKKIGTYLVDVHSQRDTLLLGSPSYQLNIVDAFAENSELLDRYRAQYKIYKDCQQKLTHLTEQAAEIKKEADYNHFLHEELQAANLTEGEQEALEEELQIKEHAEDIKNKLLESSALLNHEELSILDRLEVVGKNLDQVAGYAEHYKPLQERLKACYLELKDISGEIANEAHTLEFDRDSLDEIQERLSLIYRLQQKHGSASVQELLDVQKELSKKIDRVLNIDEELNNCEKQYADAEKQLRICARELSASRSQIFEDLQNQLEILLRDLGMPNASIQIRNKVIEPASMGMDDVKILFTANVGVQPDELRNVASGGEFSRLMFAVKYILAAKTALPSIVFDEIDNGISGEVALKMVKMMNAMSDNHQVIAITHLPQIAARGDAHFYVFKEQVENRTISKIKLLNEKERVMEIAKMIGGETPSEVAQQSAVELLDRKN
jgi:DNA repair protein RecN (Recombination protein N)